ncbi:sodium/glucose cotransporter 4-like [Centruroides vittatus]|uniref:sodium/glucose cotransporter 4-like n=1 Tax=Centruroides vittatus TaxID=120091 RepID=UPI00350E9954
MDKIGNTELYWEDILVILIYFIILIFIGFWSSYKSTKDSVSGYFLANRSMNWFMVGASLFSSNIGSEHFIGLAGSGAGSGIGIAVFELNALYVLLILGWLFIPVYMASGVYTMPEYLRKRFGGRRIRIYLAVLAFLIYVFTKISADLYAGALFINQSIKLELYSSVLTLIIIAALVTMTGGLTAVMWTDTIQTLVMLSGALVLMILSLIQVGGFNKLMEKYATAVPTNDSLVGYDRNNRSCSLPNPYYKHFMRPITDPELPFTGVVFGSTIASIWYWCADQVIVQRALSAKSISHAKAGCILAGYCKLSPLFFLVIPGMAARVLFPDILACSNPEKCEAICGNANGCTNIAYPQLVLHLMPAGVRGMMLFVMLGALISSLTSIFNSSTTIFTMDVWTTIRKHPSEMELLIVGRVFVLILVAIGVAWIPIIKNNHESQLFLYVQSISSYLSPPVCAVFLLGVLFPRINEKGAFWGLVSGLVIGLIRFGLEYSYTVPPCASKLPDPRPAIISKVHFLHFGCILFVSVCIIATVVSLMTKPIPEKNLYRLTFWSKNSPELREDLNETYSETITMDGLSEGIENPEFFEEKDVEMFNDDSNIQQSDVEDRNKRTASEPSFSTRAFYIVCGISETLRKNKDHEMERISPQEEVRRALEFTEDNPILETVCNMNAVFVLIIASFLYGYFA